MELSKKGIFLRGKSYEKVASGAVEGIKIFNFNKVEGDVSKYIF